MQNSRPTDIALRESASEENSVDDVGMSISSQASQIKMSQHDTKFLASSYGPHFGTFDSISLMASAAAIGLIALNAFPESASAASSSSTNASVWLNALVAYGHYLFLLAMTALVTYERATVKANMSMDTEKSLVIADAAYGLTSVLLFVTGYLRVTEYGKGWNFYSHEPFFWLKLSALGVLAGLSLFPTIVLVRRGQALFANTDSNDDDNNNNRDQTKGGSSLQLFEPMSERLAGRMRKVMNAELTALATIPLMATCMARGIGYAEWFPWQAGAALTAVSLFGSSFVYARQALTWKEVEE